MIFYEWRDFTNALKNTRGNLCVAGAGYWGELLGDFLNQNQIMWKCFLDIKHFDNSVCGKRVFPYEYIYELDHAYVVIATPLQEKNTMDAKIHIGICKQIVAQLRMMNISDKYIIVPGTTQIMMDIMNELHGIYAKVSRISTFKNKYKGRRCFVIGNGPSLEIGDLEHIQHEISFASNTIYALYDFTKWRPTYYCVIDAVMSKIIFQEHKMKYLLKNCDAMFAGVNRYRYLTSDGEFSSQLFFFHTILEGGTEKEIGFSDDAEKALYAGGSVTYRMLQLAVYMGFSTIFLLGVDFSYSVERDANGNIKTKNVINHNDIIEKEEMKYYPMVNERFGYSYLASTDLQLWGYYAAKRYADTHGIKIYNATRGGNLKVFDRVDFDRLFCYY